MPKFLLSISLLLMTTLTYAQNSIPDPLNMEATRTEQAPKIDGVLDDACWQTALAATNFTENSPEPGTPSSQKTEVKIVYTDNSIYVGARLHDDEPDKILKELGVRDNGNVNADFFSILIDPFHNKQDAFAFGTTAAGVQADARFTSNGEDAIWDAVWHSAVKIDDKGWVVEFEIPYSALRFPEKAEQVWGINFFRNIRRTREDSFWNPVDPNINGFVQQFGTIKGLKDISPPLRLSFTPYVATYLVNATNEDPNKSNWSPSITGGMDVKYGISESFTLDMALIPDFGQVISDNVELNLGPFEQRFDENRPFFTEGTEIFERGDIFYSRRVGNTPTEYWEAEDQVQEGETMVSNPNKVQLLNATKVSGRTSDNWGVGIFNALTSTSYATIENDITGETRKVLTEPIANYSVLVVDKLFRNNSFVSLTNTNVMRNGHFRDANVTATQFRVATKNNNYAVSGSAKLSQLFSREFDNNRQNGYAYNIAFDKISGQWTYGVRRNVESDTYNPNDLGFLFNANEVSHRGYVEYTKRKPFSIFNSMSGFVSLGQNGIYEPANTYTGSYVSMGGWANTKKFFAFGMNMNMNFKSYDYFEARTEGQKFNRPANANINGWISSDYRKKVALDANAGFGKHINGWNQTDFWFSIGPRFRLSDKFSIFPRLFMGYTFNNIGYVNIDENDDIIFGKRDRRNMISTLTGTYLFTNLMSVSIRGRHYWGIVEYSDYHKLKEDGDLTDTNYNDNHHTNFNVFNIDLVYRWRFAPGSEMNFIWKNSAFSVSDELEFNYGRNMRSMFQEDQENIFSIKVLYFLDYLDLKKLKRRK